MLLMGMLICAVTIENSIEVPQKTKNRVAAWSSNLTPRHYTDITVIQKDTRSPMFIAALFTIANTWKQSKCPLSDERIKKMWYMYTMENYSAIRKEWNIPICSNMDEPRDYYTKWSKSERERQTPYDITYMWNLKYDTNELNYKTETDIENRLVAKGLGRWEMNGLQVRG